MLYLISNCTSGKKIPTKPIHLFRNYCHDSIDDISVNWKNNLEDIQFEKIKARNLYKGVAWKAILDAEKQFNKEFETTLLVASAGYGLINVDKLVSSYGITFSKNQLDSVSKHFRNKEWWSNINQFDLTEFQNVSAIFIYLSKEYLKAMNDYIEELIRLHGDKVFIISVSKECYPNLDANMLYFDKRFNEYEPGTLISLGQRCMRWLSKEITKNGLELNLSILQKYIDVFLDNHHTKITKKGKQVSDNELEYIIKQQLSMGYMAVASRSLKTLRTNGYSCEQKRFHNVFNTIKKSLNGN